MEVTVIYLSMVQWYRHYKFKAKDSEIVAIPLWPGNTSKEFSVDTLKKRGFNGYVCDFSIDYDAIAIDDILVFLFVCL